MSSGEVRKVSRQDIQLVQNLIECCLQLYMNQKEVVDTLSFQAKIEPSFTELVWQKLEEENREFFKAYHVRLMLKNQITVFNKLLERQVELMQKSCPTSIDPASVSNGSISAPWNAPAAASASSRPNDLLCNGVSSSSLTNGRPMGQDGNHVINGPSVLAGSIDRSNSMVSAQNSSIGGASEINGAAIKTEPVYSNNAGFPFYADNSFLEARQPVGDASAGSFRSSEFTGQMNDPLLDMDTSYGFSQIPRNFSFSDLTDDFTQCADILEYGRSPFLPHEASNFQDSPGKEFTDEESRRLDTISEGVSYEDFGSD